MKKLYPYQWIMLMLLSVAGIFFLKINKHSFYLHYFRTIEEVEFRNSQEVDSLLPVFQLPSISNSSYLSVLSLILGLGSMMLVWIFFQPLMIHTRRELAVVQKERPLLVSRPVRAP